MRTKKITTIEYIREQLGMTQEEFAKALGLCRCSIIIYEAGIRPPSRKGLEKIQKLLDKVKPPLDVKISQILKDYDNKNEKM